MRLVDKLAREFIADGARFDPAYWSNLGERADGQLDGFRAGFRAARELIQEHLEGLHPVSQQDVASLAAFGEQDVPGGTP